MTPQPSTSPVLSYSSRTATPPGPGLWRVALFCGLLPLTVGLLDIVAWYFTADGWTVSLGLLTLASGPIIVFVGFVCAAVYAGLQARAGIAMRAWFSTFVVLCLLYASNFVAAYGCLQISSIVPPKNSMTVTNASSERIISWWISGRPADLGPIDPGKERNISWRNRRGQQSTAIEFVYPDGVVRSADVVGYHTGGPEGEEATVVLTPDKVTVDGRASAPTTLPSARP